MGEVILSDGTELKIVTGVDDNSRSCVAAGLIRRGTSKALCGVLTACELPLPHWRDSVSRPQAKARADCKERRGKPKDRDGSEDHQRR
jgi:hypothetical protein